MNGEGYVFGLFLRTLFEQSRCRFRDISVNFCLNGLKFSEICQKWLFYILFNGIISTSNCSSFTVFWKNDPKKIINFSRHNKHIAYLIEQIVLCSFLNIFLNFHYFSINRFCTRAETPKQSIHFWRHGKHIKPQVLYS